MTRPHRYNHYSTWAVCSHASIQADVFYIHYLCSESPSPWLGSRRLSLAHPLSWLVFSCFRPTLRMWLLGWSWTTLLDRPSIISTVEFAPYRMSVLSNERLRKAQAQAWTAPLVGLQWLIMDFSVSKHYKGWTAWRSPKCARCWLAD